MKDKETKRLGTKRYIVILLFLAILLASGTAFAYWVSTLNVEQAPVQEPDVNIGEGEEANTVVTVTPTEDDNLLVPAGRVEHANQTEALVFEYVVAWTGDVEATGAVGTLDVTADLTNLHNLLNVVIAPASQTIVANGATVLVTVTVTLDEPANKAEYDEVANQVFTFDLNFVVTPTP